MTFVLSCCVKAAGESPPFLFLNLKAFGMSRIHPAFVEYQRRRFMRPDARRWVRADAARYQDKKLSCCPLLFDKKAYDVPWNYKFNPGQPRVPAGSSDGGQWT